VRQSSDIDRYLSFLKHLVDKGITYACHCSRSELAMVSGHDEGKGIYPGYCRIQGSITSEKPYSLRILAVPLEIEFRDRLQGLCCQNLEREVGDFILYRKDKVVSYHLATIVDERER
jgi:glutamyl-Q tRNA(Asp) synthetase